MGNHKNQHFVPQFYLKGFSSDRKTIGTLILSSKKFVKDTAIKDQCSKNNFYQDKGYEIALSNFEGDTSLVFEKIMTESQLSNAEKSTVKAFMLLQKTRTKHSADIAQKHFDQLTNRLEQLAPSENSKLTLEKLRVDNHEAVELMKSLFPTTLLYCADLTLKVIVNKTHIPFITCDDPLLTYNKHLERLHHHNYGMSCNGLILLLPISPSYALVLYDANTYKMGTRKEFYVHISSLKDIEEICILSILHASQTIYIKNGSIAVCQLLELMKAATKYCQQEDMEIDSYRSRTGSDELIHAHSEHFHIGARLEFLKELDKAKAIKSLNKRDFNVMQITRPYCIKIHENKPYKRQILSIGD